MATKTNSLVGRLTAIELPAVDDVADGLENHHLGRSKVSRSSTRNW